MREQTAAIETDGLTKRYGQDVKRRVEAHLDRFELTDADRRIDGYCLE